MLGKKKKKMKFTAKVKNNKERWQTIKYNQ